VYYPTISIVKTGRKVRNLGTRFESTTPQKNKTNAAFAVELESPLRFFFFLTGTAVPVLYKLTILLGSCYIIHSCITQLYYYLRIHVCSNTLNWYLEE
jgi:hypothetical protein